MTELALAVVVAAEKTPAEEGRDIIVAMLVVGVIFLSVILLGEFLRWYSHRRARRAHYY